MVSGYNRRLRAIANKARVAHIVTPSFGSLAVLLTLLIFACPAARAEAVKFDWRHVLEEAYRAPPKALTPEAVEEQPNPVVLPRPEAEEKEDGTDTGLYWMRPRIAGSPGGNSDRTAIQLAEQAQQAEMARKNSPLNDVLPGSLSGLAPLAVESGIEWRF